MISIQMTATGQTSPLVSSQRIGFETINSRRLAYKCDKGSAYCFAQTAISNISNLNM